MLLLTSCYSQNVSKTFYEENENNTVKEIKYHNNKIFILGQHFTKNDTLLQTTSILCLDSYLNKLWDKNYGNQKLNERFVSFSVTKEGNLYVAGYNGKTKSALLLKINQLGEQIWKKEYNSLEKFDKIEIYNDSSIILLGYKHFSDTQLYQDSSVIVKMDLNGNTFWSKSITLGSYGGYIKIAKDKVIFCTNTSNYIGRYPDSKLFCINQNGQIDWTFNLDLKNTTIDNGVNAINLKIENKKDIYILCKSHNMYNNSIVLFKFDTLGSLLNSIKIDFSKLPEKENSKDAVFLLSDFILNRNKEEPYQILLRKNKKNYPYFSSSIGNLHLIDFIETKNSIYSISNISLGKNYLAWHISKVKK